MCGSSPSSSPSLLAGKPYSGNYGYEATSEAPTISAEERQWYQDNGYGDPMAVVKVAKPNTGVPLGGKNAEGGGSPLARVRTKNDYKSFYQGVKPQARDLYQQSLASKSASKSASAAASTAASTAAAGTSAMLATPPSNTRYAGKALTINPMSS